MKLGITFLILGIFGVVQYIYFQSTSLALEYAGVITEKIAGVEVVTEVLYTRDWSMGIIGFLVGIILLPLGIFWLVKQRARKRYAQQLAN